MARTNLAIDRRLFEEFATQASRRNMTLYAFGNESLSVISNISAEGGNPQELYRLWKATSIMKEVGVIVLPSDFVEEQVSQLYHMDRERTLARFGELGASLAALLRIVAEDVEDLISLAKGFFFLIPVKHFEVLTLRNGSIQVNVVGAGAGIETTECSNEFLKSVLRGYGYDITNQQVHPGVIQLWAEPKNQQKSTAKPTPHDEAAPTSRWHIAT